MLSSKKYFSNSFLSKLTKSIWLLFYLTGTGTCSQSNFRHQFTMCLSPTSHPFRPELQSNFFRHRPHEGKFMVSHTFKFMLTQSNIQGISKKEMALKICPFSQKKKNYFTKLFMLMISKR